MDRPGDHCSIASTLGVVGDRWTLLILRDVFRGLHRFSELQADLGIARNLLADRLGRLVDEGVLERVPYQLRPLRHEYRLTAKGADLSPALVALMAWGDRWYAEAGPPVELYHDRCGTALEHRPRCPACDELVSPGHIRSRPGPGAAQGDRRPGPGAAQEDDRPGPGAHDVRRRVAR